MTDKPEAGKVYALTGGPGSRCIANGNSWSESEVTSHKPQATSHKPQASQGTRVGPPKNDQAPSSKNRVDRSPDLG